MKGQNISERDWQAEDDARTLMIAKEIEADKKRFNNALKKAKSLVQEKEKEVQMMKSIAGKEKKNAVKKGKKQKGSFK